MTTVSPKRNRVMCWLIVNAAFLVVLAGVYFLLTIIAERKCTWVYPTGEIIIFCDPRTRYMELIAFLGIASFLINTVWFWVAENETAFASKTDWFLKSRRVNASAWTTFILMGYGSIFAKGGDAIESFVGWLCFLALFLILARVLVRDTRSFWTRNNR